jgi:hypothetical protein
MWMAKAAQAENSRVSSQSNQLGLPSDVPPTRGGALALAYPGLFLLFCFG